MAHNDPPRSSGTFARRSTATTMIAISVYTAIAAGVLWRFENIPAVARVLLGLPVLLFTPGYAVIAALFPRTGAVVVSSRLERGILGVVASIAIVPMIALASTVTGSIDLALVLAGIAGLTVLASAVAIVRETLGEPDPRGPDPYRDSSDADSTVRNAATDGLTLLAIAITALLLVASAAVAYTDDGGNQLLNTDDRDDQPMTEFYLVNESGPGTDTAVDGQNAYDLRINHFSSESQQYSVVLLLDPASDTGQSWSELDRSSIAVGPDETATVTYRISQSEVAANDTVRFLLYTDEAPSTPDPDTAHRSLSISVEGADE